jgi:hypothetical protein
VSINVAPGFTGPTGPTGRGATGPTGARGVTGPTGQQGREILVHNVPSPPERILCSIHVGKNVRLLFHAWATAFESRGYNSSRVDSYASGAFVGMYLSSPTEGTMINVCPVTVGTPALLSPSWVATVVETEAARLGLELDPLDLAVLEEEAGKAYRAALSHCMTAFSMFLVDKGLGRQEAADAFNGAVVRHVMTQ